MSSIYQRLCKKVRRTNETGDDKIIRRMIKSGKATRCVFAKQYNPKTDRWELETKPGKKGRPKRTWRQISSLTVLEKGLYETKPNE